jgi:hypothetical protein
VEKHSSLRNEFRAPVRVPSCAQAVISIQ